MSRLEAEPMPVRRYRRSKRFTATLGDGRTVVVRPLGNGEEPTGFGEVGRTVGRMAALDEVEALQAGISVPTAWVAGVEGRPADLGLAWFTTLVGSPETAAAEVRLAAGATRLGLGPMLLDTLVIAATERGVACLSVRLSELADDYVPSLARHGARFTVSDGGVLTASLSLGGGQRRFHWSGMHRNVTGPLDAL